MDAAVRALALTIYGEARNQPDIGMQAIACVVMNRVRHGGWWGNSIIKVCLKPMQFSCWNNTPDNAKNKIAMMGASDADPVFLRCVDIAQQAIAGTLKDCTNGADSYFVKGTNAPWAKNLTPVASIGAHDFYVTV